MTMRPGHHRNYTTLTDVTWQSLCRHLLHICRGEFVSISAEKVAPIEPDADLAGSKQSKFQAETGDLTR